MERCHGFVTSAPARSAPRLAPDRYPMRPFFQPTSRSRCAREDEMRKRREQRNEKRCAARRLRTRADLGGIVTTRSIRGENATAVLPCKPSLPRMTRILTDSGRERKAMCLSIRVPSCCHWVPVRVGALRCLRFSVRALFPPVSSFRSVRKSEAGRTPALRSIRRAAPQAFDQIKSRVPALQPSCFVTATPLRRRRPRAV